MKLQAVLAAGRMGGDMGKLITTTGQSAQLLDGGVLVCVGTCVSRLFSAIS